MITEYLPQPDAFRADLLSFQRGAFGDLVDAARKRPEALPQLQGMNTKLIRLITSCETATSITKAARLSDAWDAWCSEFEEFEHPQLEQPILAAYIALPCQ